MQVFTGSEAGTRNAYPTVAGIPVGEIGTPAEIGGVQLPAAVGPSPGEGPRRGMLELRLEAISAYEPSASAANEAPPVGLGGMAPTRWNWLGPGNIGGRTRSIVIHPTRPGIMWLGAVAGGIWKTYDEGKSWAPLADFMASLNVSALILDPQNPDTLFAGTGEGYYNSDAFKGAGLFRSQDGGATWDQVSATAVPDYDFVNRLAITSDGSTLLLATRTGIYRSVNFRATDVSQVAFQPAESLSDKQILDIACSSSSAKECVASGYEGRVYYSADGGINWILSTGLPNPPFRDFEGRVEITYAKADPSVVYASVDRNLGEIYRSTDGGRSFSLQSSGAYYLSKQGWYGNTIWAGDPSRAELLIVGGVDLYRSVDGGRTLTKISDWRLSPASPHADHHAIVSHPGYNGTTNRMVFFGNDGGLYRSNDVLSATPRTSWSNLNNGYGATEFYGGAGNIYSGRIVAGAQDNGTDTYVPPPGSNTGPNGWTAMFGGDGGFVAADPIDPNMMYGEYVYLQLHRSIDGGGRSNYMYEGIEDAGSNKTALFIAPFILDPANPANMLAGGANLWRSPNVTSATPSWSPIKSPIQATATGSAPLISAIDARPLKVGAAGSDLVWVGYNSGDLFYTDQALSDEPAWTSIRDVSQAPLPKRFVTRIRIDPNNTNTVYACFTGYLKSNLWKTTDGGRTWNLIGDSLPAVPVYDVAIHPKNPNFLYVATEVGVFASADAGQTWWPTNQGPANVAVSELFWMEQRLISVTHGRGIFWIDLTQGGPAISMNPQSIELNRSQFRPPAVTAVSPMNVQ
ncbi:WD40/YVTN/BNR-like repeat-containing protein [Rhizobium ruizarguesonis]|uniref:WD40/YVTN/BNR-like repeat-containing protein n=1 Tax=Rhizobium ruizarguesonis TaxID=2081791 RepID=UPI001030A3E5|nr:hypothetical protein [Rhizobium ruizarguesonis]TBD34338.1 hypothetical protein ELH17_30600 [Rhizobium ruizarguesonis]TBD55056.1 hypothetical protein ELH16_34580 [Rhizobium ruizarguesonis]TBF01958.1 hypothetical protein ELG96_32430 [Rhizobium ruizarguesonis]